MNIKTRVLNIADKLLDKMQEINNKRYEEDGLTDKVINEQVYINRKRNKADLADKSEMIYEEFVQ